MQGVIFCGIQGAGKSTYYKQNFFNSHIRISMDLLKTRRRERLLLQLCISTQARFVVDNTNATSEERSAYIKAAKDARYQLICFYFDAPLPEALLRNSQRSGKELIPEKGIRATHKRLQPPDPSEGFDYIFTVKLTPDNGYQLKQTYPIIADIDEMR